MRWRPALVGPVVALAIGCASGAGSSQWVRPDTTDDQRERDKTDCLLAATDTAPGGPGGPRQRVNQDRYRRCLESRGYELRPPPASR